MNEFMMLGFLDWQGLGVSKLHVPCSGRRGCLAGWGLVGEFECRKRRRRLPWGRALTPGWQCCPENDPKCISWQSWKIDKDFCTTQLIVSVSHASKLLYTQQLLWCGVYLKLHIHNYTRTVFCKQHDRKTERKIWLRSKKSFYLTHNELTTCKI